MKRLLPSNIYYYFYSELQLPDKPVFVPPAVATADPPPPVNQLLQTLNHRFVEIAANSPCNKNHNFSIGKFSFGSYNFVSVTAVA